MNFGSDNVHGVHDAILDAIRDANTGTARGLRPRRLVRRAPRPACAMSSSATWPRILVVTGTAANSLALAACCPPHGAVVCHAEAHINTDECGAPEMYTGGAKLMGVRGAARQAHARRRGADARRHGPRRARAAAERAVALAGHRARHRLLRRRGRGARRHWPANGGMHVHMDGARFANALVRLGCIAGGAHVEGRRGRACRSAPPRTARSAWRRCCSSTATSPTTSSICASAPDSSCRRAATSARRCSRISTTTCGSATRATPTRWPTSRRAACAALPGVRLPLPVEANEVFAIVPRPLHDALQAAGARYLVWPGEGPGTDTVADGEVFIRLLTSFRTTAQDVDTFVSAAADVL